MKKKHNNIYRRKVISVWLLSMAFLFVSCNKDIEPSIAHDSGLFGQASLTKACIPDFQIYPSDVEWLVKNLYPEAGAFEIEAYPNDEKPLLYAVNFDKGWKIVAGDKRVDPILAYNNEGDMKLTDSSNPGLKIWIEEISNSIQSLDGIKEEYYENLRIWKYDFPQEHNIQTKSGNGLWYRELYGEYLSGGYIRAIDPLLLTKWGQEKPWNEKAPYKYQSTEKCPLGCGPVALSQILYYFHFHNEIPQGLYHTIIGNDHYQYYPNIYGEWQAWFTISRDDYTSPSDRWSQMPVDSISAIANLTYAQYVGDLILDVGDRLDTRFEIGGTSTDSSTVVNALSHYDLTSTLHDYGYNLVYNDLSCSKPVIILGLPANRNGHAWVIDGHHQDLITTRRVYIWHEANSSWSGEVFTTAEAQAMLGDTYTLREGLGYLETSEAYGPNYFHLNWGWNGKDDGYYAISSPRFTVFVDKKIVYDIHSTP